MNIAQVIEAAASGERVVVFGMLWAGDTSILFDRFVEAARAAQPEHQPTRVRHANGVECLEFDTGWIIFRSSRQPGALRSADDIDRVVLGPGASLIGDNLTSLLPRLSASRIAAFTALDVSR